MTSLKKIDDKKPRVTKATARRPDGGRIPARVRGDTDPYRKIFDGAAIGMAVVSLDGRFLHVNGQLARMTGYPVAELQESGVFQLLCHDYVEQSRERFQRLNSGDLASYSVEKQFVKKDGTVFWINASIAAVNGPGGRPSYLVATYEDIDEKKRMADAMLTRIEKYMMVVETTVDGFWITDKEGRLLEVNDAYCRMSGYSRAELLSKRVTDLENLAMPAFAQIRFGDILRSGFLRFETDHTRKDGKTMELLGTASYSERLPDIVFFFFHEIGEIRLRERTIHDAWQQQHALIESIPDALVFKDGDGRWRLINERARRLFNLSDEEWMGRTDHELGLMRPDYAELHRLFALDDEFVWRSGKPGITQVRARPPGRNGVVLDIRKSPIIDMRGNRRSMLVDARDITLAEKVRERIERSKRKQRRLEERALAAESALVNVSEYTAIRQRAESIGARFSLRRSDGRTQVAIALPMGGKS